MAQHNYAVFCEDGRGVPHDTGEAACYYRLAAEQGHVGAQICLSELLLDTAAAGRALPAAPGEAARFLAQAAQQTGDEESRLKALAVLSEYTHEPDVVKACGKTQKLRACLKCRTARFCGAECIWRMWPLHKQSCKTFPRRGRRPRPRTAVARTSTSCSTQLGASVRDDLLHAFC